MEQPLLENKTALEIASVDKPSVLIICSYCHKPITEQKHLIKYNVEYPKEEIYPIHTDCLGDFTCLYSIIRWNGEHSGFISSDYPEILSTTNMTELIALAEFKKQQKAINKILDEKKEIIPHDLMERP